MFILLLILLGMDSERIKLYENILKLFRKIFYATAKTYGSINAKLDKLVIKILI